MFYCVHAGHPQKSVTQNTAAYIPLVHVAYIATPFAIRPGDNCYTDVSGVDGALSKTQ